MESFFILFGFGAFIASYGYWGLIQRDDPTGKRIAAGLLIWCGIAWMVLTSLSLGSGPGWVRPQTYHTVIEAK